MSLQLFTLHPQMEPVLLVGHIKALCEIATKLPVSNQVTKNDGELLNVRLESGQRPCVCVGGVRLRERIGLGAKPRGNGRWKSRRISRGVMKR